MKVFQINTTAYQEEDFFLLTDLTNDQISEVIQPIVNAERDGYDEYDDESISIALKNRFPNNYVEMFYDFEKLIF
jgi:hypothetical protein